MASEIAHRKKQRSDPVDACFILLIQMFVAIYVHLQPGVPANVLPFGIKPPVIPIAILFLGLLTAFDVWKQLQAEKA